ASNRDAVCVHHATDDPANGGAATHHKVLDSENDLERSAAEARKIIAGGRIALDADTNGAETGRDTCELEQTVGVAANQRFAAAKQLGAGNDLDERIKAYEYGRGWSDRGQFADDSWRRFIGALGHNAEEAQWHAGECEPAIVVCEQGASKLTGIRIGKEVDGHAADGRLRIGRNDLPEN